MKQLLNDNIMGYDVKRHLKIITVTKNTKVAYIIKTLLEIINRWEEVEIHVITKYSGSNNKN